MTKINRQMLEKAYPIEYVNNGFNGTKAYLSVKKGAKPSTARSESTRLSAKPSIQKAIADLLPSDEYHRDKLKEVMDLQPEQPLSYGEKLKYIRTSLELKGKLGGNTNTGNVNIGLIIER